MNRAARISLLLAASLLALAALAAPVMAADGVGLYGRTDDKVITFFAFGVMAFIVVLITVLTVIQSRLESRKERARADLERLRRP